VILGIDCPYFGRSTSAQFLPKNPQNDHWFGV